MRRTILAFLLAVLAPISLQAQFTGGGKPGQKASCDSGTSPGHHCCWNEVLKIVSGAPINQVVLDQYKSSDDIHWWGSGGSENIPTLCRTADYWKNGDPSWFHGYYDDQLPGGDALGYQGTEILSPLYTPWVVTASMAVLQKARAEGHTGLETKAENWLRTYWALNALVARQGPWTETTAVNENGTFVDNNGNQNEFDGLSTPSAGTRRVSVSDDPTTTGQAEVHMGQYLLTLALDHSPRSLTRPDLISDDYFRAMRLGVHLLGGSFEPDDTLDFAAVPTPVDRFGLTATERATLESFIANPGDDPATLNTVLGYIGHGTRCTMTFLRTTEGTSVWFGDDTSAQSRCNGNTAPWYGVTMTNAGVAQVLTPEDKNRSRRSGNKIQAYHTNGPSTTEEIDLIGGSTIYRVIWRSNGPDLDEYNPPINPVDLRMIASYVPSAGGARIEFTSESDNPPSFGFYYDETLGNFEENPGGPCNTGQDNPTYLKIRYEGDAFESCTFQASYDPQPQACSPGLIAHLLAGGEVRLGTDDYRIDPATCEPFQPLEPLVRPFENHWMRLSIVKDGQTYHRRVNYMQNNPTPPEILLIASYVPAVGQPRTEFRSEHANPDPFDFYYDASLGNFQEHPGFACNTGQNNPTYLKIRYQGPDIQSCSFQASWDASPQECIEPVITALEAGNEIAIGTDTYVIDASTCVEAQPLVQQLPFNTVGWMLLDVTTAEGNFLRKVSFVKKP